MKVVYQGSHLDVEVLDDALPGGRLTAARGVAVEVPNELAEQLFEHGRSSDPEGPHNPTWRKASAKEAAAADKAAERADAPKEGDA